MLRLFLGICLGFVISCRSQTSAEFPRSEGPRLVIHHYPRSSDHGAVIWDCPVYAAYGDGTIIWRRGWRNSIDAFAIAKSDESLKDVRAIETTLEEFLGKTFTLTSSSDPEITTIWIQ